MATATKKARSSFSARSPHCGTERHLSGCASMADAIAAARAWVLAGEWGDGPATIPVDVVQLDDDGQTVDERRIFVEV